MISRPPHHTTSEAFKLKQGVPSPKERTRAYFTSPPKVVSAVKFFHSVLRVKVRFCIGPYSYGLKTTTNSKCALKTPYSPIQQGIRTASRVSACQFCLARIQMSSKDVTAESWHVLGSFGHNYLHALSRVL